jgi:hypothetical protein
MHLVLTLQCAMSKTQGGHMNSCQQNFNAGYCRINATHVRRFERFLKKNKLDNALVVTEFGEVVDLYAEAILNSDVGFWASIWMKFCTQLSKGFYWIGTVFIKASNLAVIWARFCYKLAGWFNFIASLLFRAGHFGS